MTRTKENLSIGEISDLTISEKLILEALSKTSMDNWSLVQNLKLSESTITKALRKLRYRGLVIREANKNKIPLKMLKKIRE